MTVEKRAEVANELLFETLKAIQATLARHGDELHDTKDSLGNLETPVGWLAKQYASLSNQMDRLVQRLERVERRVGVIEVWTPPLTSARLPGIPVIKAPLRATRTSKE